MKALSKFNKTNDEIAEAILSAVQDMLPDLEPQVYVRPPLRAPDPLTRITVDWYELADVRRGLMLTYPTTSIPPIAWAVRTIRDMITRILTEDLQLSLNARWVPGHLKIAYSEDEERTVTLGDLVDGSQVV